MTDFFYRAINDDNKEVQGHVDAFDIEAANNALKDQHLDIVELHEATRSGQGNEKASTDQQPSLLTMFAFEGTDGSGVIRRGTIQSESKYQAFEKLKMDQKLFVSMLSPLGVTPQYRDHDLENWQKKTPPIIPAQTSPSTSQAPTIKPVQKPVAFTLPETPKPVPVTNMSDPVAHISSGYQPLSSTLRLYAGWLLAWYGLFVTLGYYATVRTLPWDIPFVQAFFISPLIFSFIVAIFLFLFLASLHRVLHGKIFSMILLTLIGIAAFVGVRMSL